MPPESFFITDDEPLPPGLPSLLSAADVPEPITLQRLEGGANNRVYCVEADGQQLLLKWYFSHPDDPRDRLSTEYSFSSFAWENGIRSLPQSLASSPDEGLALYEYIDGRQLSSVEIIGEHIQAALDFYHSLNRHKAHPGAEQLRDGSEACFKIIDHLTCVEDRLRILHKLDRSHAIHRDAMQFVEHKLMPVWNDAVEFVHADASRCNLPLDCRLDRDDQCLSPSDFGFHNAIVDGAGIVRFIDFEYAGWDDPAKMVCDFFCQVEAAIPRDYLTDFTDSVTAVERQPEHVQQRIRLLFPVYQLKWCCILLNEFLPTAGARRRFSRTDDSINHRKKLQLDKARQLLSEMMESPIDDGLS